MTHEQQVDNIGAYALGALPELEAQVFERHLMGCERVRRSCVARSRRSTPLRGR